MAYSGRFLKSPEDTSTCLTIVGVGILATYFLRTRTIFVQSFIRFIGVEKHRGLIALVLIGASTIVGVTLPLELSGKFGENKKCMAQKPLLLSPYGLHLRGGTL